MENKLTKPYDTYTHESLNELTIKQLVDLNKLVHSLYTQKKALLNRRVKLSLVVGQYVQIDKKQYEGKTFVVEKINRTTANVKSEDDYLSVPLTMILQ
jgi:hypothetical protein